MSASNEVKDRSGLGKPPKAERRALGKIAAAKRARAKRRRMVLERTGFVVAGIAVLGGLAYLFGFFDAATPDPTANPSASASAPAEQTGFTLPPGADPALNTKPEVTKGEGELTELKVTTLIEGTGPATVSGQMLTVNYVGVKYVTGEEFDASWTNNRPLPFKVGEGGVIQGWDQGLIGVKVGSRVQLDIPKALAYPDKPDTADSGGPLRFVVDILDAQDPH